MSPGTGCSASRVLAVDLQRCRRVAVAATLGGETPVAAVLVQQLLQSPAARRDNGVRDPAAAVRGTGTSLSAGISVQVSISGAVRCCGRGTGAVLRVHWPHVRPGPDRSE